MGKDFFETVYPNSWPGRRCFSRGGKDASNASTSAGVIEKNASLSVSTPAGRVSSASGIAIR